MAAALQDLHATQTTAPRTIEQTIIKKLLMPPCLAGNCKDCAPQWINKETGAPEYECTCGCHREGA